MASLFESKLPRELRDQIYGYLVTSDCTLNRTHCTGSHMHLLSTNILSVNKLIYDEASELLYSTNAFRIWLHDLCPGDMIRRCGKFPDVDDQLPTRVFKTLEIRVGSLTGSCCQTNLVACLVGRTVPGRIAKPRLSAMRNAKNIRVVLVDEESSFVGLYSKAESEIQSTQFDGVGHFATATHLERITFVHQPIIHFWRHLASLPPQHDIFSANNTPWAAWEDEPAKMPPAVREAPWRTKITAMVMLRSCYEEKAAANGGDWSRVRAWVSEVHREEEYERLTRARSKVAPP